MVFRRTARSRPLALVTAAALVLAVAGCTSKSATSTTTSTSTSTSASSGSAASSAFKYPSGAVTQAQAAQVVQQLEGPIPRSVGDTTRGISGHTITVAGVADITAEGQTIEAGGCAGAQAAFAAADRAGGVNGYKINYIGCSDDQSSGTLALQDIQKYVDVDHAFAIVPQGSLYVNGTFLNQNHVPYFGLGSGEAYCPGYASLSYGVSPVDGVGCTLAPAAPNESVLSDEALACVLVGLHLNPANVKWALVGEDLSQTKIIQDDYVEIVQKYLGGQVVYNAVPGPAPGAPPLADWGPVAQAVVKAGTNVVDIVSLEGTAFEGFVAALKAAGYKGVIYSSPNQDIDLSSPSQAALLQGVYLQSAWASATVYPGSYMDQIGADLKAIGSTANPNDDATAFSFMSAEFFLDALAALKGPLTAENLMNMINAGFTFPGQANGWSSIPYPGGRLAQDEYVGLVEVKGNQEVGVLAPGDYGRNFFLSV
jgi:branched-chain amino acid transport system substrate-binding protein